MSDIKLISTQIVVDVEVGVELGKNSEFPEFCIGASVRRSTGRLLAMT